MKQSEGVKAKKKERDKASVFGVCACVVEKDKGIKRESEREQDGEWAVEIADRDRAAIEKRKKPNRKTFAVYIDLE